MSLHYTLMGNTRKGPNQRVYHGQNQAMRQEDTLRDTEKERPKNTLHGENAHVRDCLVWDLNDGNKQGVSVSPYSPRRGEPMKRTPRENEFTITNYKPLPRYPELGRARNHLYGEDGPPNLHSKSKTNDGGVADAMVGWPQERKLEEERQARSGVEWEIDGFENTKPKTTRRNQRIGEGDSDVVMDELISHRYQRENEERLRRLREQEIIEQAAVQRNRFNALDNRASILRAEAIKGGAGVGREDPKELWKMPRFTNAAKSRLNECTKCKRHDCYHADGRGFPTEPGRTECKKCSKENGKGMCEKGPSKALGDKTGNQSQEDAGCHCSCPCCQSHHLPEPEESSFYQHQQPEKQAYMDDSYPKSGLFVL